jgi:tetratricopeptide (TPR) repeat protein
VLSFVTSARGDLSETIEMAAQLVRAGQDAADPQLQSWGFQARGYAELALGPLDEAIANMRLGVALAEKMHSWDNFLFLSSLLGKGLVLQGKLEEAGELLDEALRNMKVEQLNRPFDQVELLTGLATAKLATAERQEGSRRQAAMREAHTTCRKALRCAVIQPRWLPEAQRLCGTADWLAGKQAAARRSWQESLATAEMSAFPIEHARTLLEMGVRTGDIVQIEQASVVFRETGANVFLALALYSLAQLRVQQSTDKDSAIRDFEAAVVALEEVNADYALACARRQYEQFESSAAPTSDKTPDTNRVDPGIE